MAVVMGNTPNECEVVMRQNPLGTFGIRWRKYKGRAPHLFVSFSRGGPGLPHLTDAAICEMAKNGFRRLDLQSWIAHKFDAGQGDRQEILLNSTEWVFVLRSDRVEVYFSRGEHFRTLLEREHKEVNELLRLVRSWRVELLELWKQERGKLRPDHMTTNWND